MQLNVLVFSAYFVLLLAKITVQDECIDYNDLIRAKGCCKVSRLFLEHEFTQECEEINADLRNSDDRAGWARCFAQCIMEKSGAISENTIDVHPLYKYADQFNGAISQAYRAAIDRCATMKFIPESHDQSRKCNQFALNLYDCLKAMLILSCPEDLRINDEVCQKFRARVPVCPNNKTT